MSPVTTIHIAKRWSISYQRKGVLCKADRIKRALMMINYWFVPDDAKPDEVRKR